MRGLLIKDYHLTIRNKQLFLVLAAIGMLMIITGNNPSFLVSYISLVSAMMVLTTITYDEFDKSMAFLLTMPVNRQQYVREKYIFGVLCTFTGWLVSTIVAVTYQFFSRTDTSWNELILPVLIFLYLALMMLLLMIPVQLKFGGDNGKVVIMAFVIAVLVISTVVTKVCAHFQINPLQILQSIMLSNKLFIGVLVVILHLTLIVISYGGSLKIIHKKEF